MRGLVRVIVVGFTLVSLLLVGVVGVSATSTSGKAQTTNAINSVVSLASAHFDQKGDQKSNNGTTGTSKEKDKGKDKDKDKGDHKCKEPKHDDATPGREHHDCGGDTDHDSD